MFRKLLREIAHRSPFAKFVFPRYDFGQAPVHLARLVELLDRALPAGGDVVEVGCLAGATTLFLDRHLTWRGATCAYVAIDTFSGFTREDVSVEQRERGKDPARLDAHFFDVNKRSWVAGTLRRHGARRVTLIEADINELPPDRLPERIAFALIDVDLRRPVTSALEKIWPRVPPGGIVVVDDCDHGDLFDGAADAYDAFCARIGTAPERIERKLGMLIKPSV